MAQDEQVNATEEMVERMKRGVAFELRRPEMSGEPFSLDTFTRNILAAMQAVAQETKSTQADTSAGKCGRLSGGGKFRVRASSGQAADAVERAQDLVQRLRLFVKNPRIPICGEAADMIEALAMPAIDEREKLRDVLKEARDELRRQHRGVDFERESRCRSVIDRIDATLKTPNTPGETE